MRKLLATTLLLATALVATPTLAGAATLAPGPTPGGGGRATPAGGFSTATPPAPTGTMLGSFLAPSPGTRSGGRTAATHLKGGVGCSIQCITSGVAYGVGPDAALVVTTDTPGTIRIVVSRAGYHRQIQSGPVQTQLSAAFDDLEADTTYDAFVSVVDGDGHMANRQGTFHTLQRNVEVVFNQAVVTADPYGSGDPFSGQVWFEGTPGEPGYLGDDVGGVLGLGINVLGDDDTDQHLSLAYELVQHEPTDDVCEYQSDGPYPSEGDGSCQYFATAWLADGSFDLDVRPAGEPVNDYWTGGTMVLSGGGALPPGFGVLLQFTVEVGVHVTFTP